MLDWLIRPDHDGLSIVAVEFHMWTGLLQVVATSLATQETVPGVAEGMRE